MGHHPQVLLAGVRGFTAAQGGCTSPQRTGAVSLGSGSIHGRARGGGVVQGEGGGPTRPSHRSLSLCGSPRSPHDPLPLGPLPC